MPRKLNKNAAGNDRWSLALLVAMAMAHLPIGYEYAIRMWNSGHYQFFPLLILVVGYLFRLRLVEIKEAQTPAKKGVTNLLLTSSFLLVAAATLSTSSFVWAISAFWLVNTIVYAIFGFGGWKRAFPVIALLIFIIPIPLGIDSALIFQMQFLASNLAGWILDAGGQVHFREGVVLYTELNSYLTEEACSGVRSLFSSLAAIAVYCVYNRHPWWRSGTNLLQTLVWVVVGNGCRVAIVVYGAEHWNKSLATGPPHEVLGLGVFLFIIAMALSTDRLINVVASRFEFRRAEHRRGAEKVAAGKKTKKDAWTLNIQFPKSSRIFIPVFAIVFLLGIRILSLGDNPQLLSSVGRLDFPVESDLPTKIVTNSGTWDRVEYEPITRDGSNIRAENSFLWTYSNGTLQANISLDCPWDDWHDLALCYQGIGWTTNSTNQFGDKAVVGLPVHNIGYTQVELSKSTGERGFVVFSSVDRNGGEVVPKFRSGYISIESVMRLLVENMSRIMGLSGSSSESLGGEDLPITAIQVFCPTREEITDKQRDEIRELFFEARKQLLQSKRFQSN